MLTRRKIIRIDEDKCDGCGLCVPACAEGAIRVIDGKARLVNEVYCDGLGACLGECPLGAITIEEREAEPFDEQAVQQHLVASAAQAPNPHAHPTPHAQKADSKQAEPLCPSARMMQLGATEGGSPRATPSASQTQSALSHWPIKLRLVPPAAPFLKGADLVLIADCVPFAYPDLHRDILPLRALAIGCPKFDDYEFSLGRLTNILRHSGVRSLTVVHMEVPCCFGYWKMAQQAIQASGKSIPLRQVITGIRGDVKPQEPLAAARRAPNELTDTLPWKPGTKEDGHD